MKIPEGTAVLNSNAFSEDRHIPRFYDAKDGFLYFSAYD